MGKIIDLTGKVFNQLTILSYEGLNSSRLATWKCKCSCGNIKVVIGLSLRYGDIKSCGCFKAKRIGDFNRTHGEGKTPEYIAWQLMKRRCNNPNDIGFKYYGRLGIKVCDRWLNSFQNFLSDLGRKPTAKHSVDRINPNGNYEPDNCRWASAMEQANNKRGTHLFNHEGVTDTVSNWCRHFNINSSAVHARVRRGWSLKRAITTPYLWSNVAKNRVVSQQQRQQSTTTIEAHP